MLKKYIGSREFYKMALSLTVPMMIQNGITNLVNMLDNIMVGRVGTVEMTGVAVANQLLFVFNLCIFGAVSGAGIFGAQFYGNGDHDGVRHTFRFKILFNTLISVIAAVIFVIGGSFLMMSFLKGDGAVEDAAMSLAFGREYLTIMLVGILPFALVQCYSSTLRETGESFVPMVASLIAVATNLVLNYILIFGKFGFPRLGVNGAAIATVISRFVELIIVAAWTVRHKDRNKFIVGAFRSVYVPRELIRDISVKGLPLMVNETLWAAGLAFLNQCYSMRGLDVVAATNISQTFQNVFSSVFLSVGGGIGIILGQYLGANRFDEAKDAATKLTVFSVFLSVIVAISYVACAQIFPRAYNTTDAIQHTATTLMCIFALAMPLDALANSYYFTLRSGGKMLITIIFDSLFVWVINVPIAFVLSRYTDFSIFIIFGACQFTMIIKDIGGYIAVKKGIWLKNIIE